MRIKKIFLYNFKNFRRETIIDFSDNITFLVGPNGFGKTTIFDAIELGLTGNISRINKVTRENITYNKPFFQNEMGYPVIIKLWLEKSDGNQIIIVRFLPDIQTNPVKDFAPVASLKKFVLLRQKELDNERFGAVEDKYIKKLHKFKQSEIDSFLGVEGKYEVEKIFTLFNYIQQDETTFFLKQTEEKRSDSLSFLVKTDRIEDKIVKSDKAIREIKNRLDELRNEIKKITECKLTDVPYQRLFNHHQFQFDSLDPFTSNNLDQLSEYKTNIQNIINFKQNFSIPEHKKKLEREDKKQRISNELDIEQALLFLILSPIITRFENKWIWEKYTLENPQLFEYVLLENYLKKYKQVVSNEERRKQLNRYLLNLSVGISNMNEHCFYYEQNDQLSSYFESLKSQYANYENKKKSVNQVDRNISELQQLRSDLGNKFYELSSHKHLDDSKCPFCSSQFKSFEDLKKAYDFCKEYLTRISSQESNSLQEAQSSVEKSLLILKQKILDELAKFDIEVDEQLLSRLGELQDQYPNYASNITMFKTFIQSYITISPYEYSSLSFETYNNQYKLKLEEFRSKLILDDDAFLLFNNKDLKNIENKFEELEEEFSEFNFSIYKLNPDSNQKIKMEYIYNRLEELKKNLQLEIDRIYDINDNLIFDPNLIFSKYFKNQIELLENTSVQELEHKMQYIDNQYNLVQTQRYQSLNQQINILELTKERLENINKIYKEEVKKFKIEIVKLLRLPFFIYSAKMLQNYQQGLGIFLTYKKSMNSKDNSAIIRFKSDPNNDHDVMNQLSTGQLAVVSLAFTLSLNTMFKLSEQLNFLMIDDPIQDMDAMNVLSFIEILRHGIMEKYQIVLSTYSDFNALFMGYKFANSNSPIDIVYKNVRELQNE